MTTKPRYVVDTNALIWHFTQHPRLGKRAREVIEAAERGEATLLVSVISVAEMYYSDKKFGHFTDFTALYERMQKSVAYEFVPLQADDIMQFNELSAVPGMHDRIIVGIASRLGLPLIASDAEIVNANLVETIW